MLLAHDDLGTGPAVLLLHSGVTDRRMWDPLVPALSHEFRVVRPDLRGYGDSPLPSQEYADADDLDALLDHLGIADAAVVGSSFGGRVALELATLHPARVSSLVLLCAALRGVEPTPDAAAFGDEEDRLLEAGDVDGAVELNVRTWLGPEADEATREQVAQMQQHAFEVQMEADAREPGPQPRRVEVGLSGIAVPTLVVSGAKDLELFARTAEAIASGIPGAEALELAWAGHLPSLERPDAVLALLLDVLRDNPTVHQP
jgi:pimeloyl-ACP methyl ester carboxylesterase